jgi:GNAT superfamily N-acetyltransferase
MIQIVPAELRNSALLKEIAVAAKGHWGYPDHLMTEWAQTSIITAESIAADVVFKARTESSVMGWYRLVPRSVTAILEDLWVLPAFMGKGIGRALFEHAVDQARRFGAQNIELDADPNAVPFYERLGCRVIGESLSEWGRIIPHMRYDLTMQDQTDSGEFHDSFPSRR